MLFGSKACNIQRIQIYQMKETEETRQRKEESIQQQKEEENKQFEEETNKLKLLTEEYQLKSSSIIDSIETTKSLK
jgi:hypothetical protein